MDDGARKTKQGRRWTVQWRSGQEASDTNDSGDEDDNEGTIQRMTVGSTNIFQFVIVTDPTFVRYPRSPFPPAIFVVLKATASA